MTAHQPRTCPCCGQPINAGRASIEALESAPLSAVKRTIVRRLAKAYPRAVSADALIDEIYSGAREPETAMNVLRAQLCRLRSDLPQYGWTIPRAPGGRGNPAFYKLEPLP